MVIPDDHAPKLQRALAHYGVLYGTRTSGQPDFANTELPFANQLDGTLFIRTAGLTDVRLARAVNDDVNDEGLLWDRHGFYKL